jgi:hypothetical protein
MNLVNKIYLLGRSTKKARMTELRTSRVSTESRSPLMGSYQSSHSGRRGWSNLIELSFLLRSSREPFRICPELPNRQRKVAADRGHYIDGHIRGTALNLSEVIGAIAKGRCQGDLRQFSRHTQLCHGTPKHLTWSLRFAALVSSDRFAHPVMVARDGGFIITTIVAYIPWRQL